MSEETSSRIPSLPSQAALLVVARAGSRALLDLPVVEARKRRRYQGDLLKCAFRAVATAWLVAEMPEAREGLRVAAGRAVSGINAALRHLRFDKKGIQSIQLVRNAASVAAIRASAAGASMEISRLVSVAAAADPQANRDIAAAARGEDLRHMPLSGTQPPKWRRFQEHLLSRNEGWEVWLDWLEMRIKGEELDRKLELAGLTLPEEIWQRPAGGLNTYIRERLEILAANPELDAEVVVPKPRPAAVEPIWQEGWLTLPDGFSESKMPRDAAAASLSALGSGLEELATKVEGEANIDGRIRDFFVEAVKRVPAGLPTQHQLFILGHAYEFMVQYSVVVDQEWPLVLAARYHATKLQFDRALRQFESWNSFRSYAESSPLAFDVALPLARRLARDTATALGEGNGAEFIDSGIASALIELAEGSGDENSSDINISEPTNRIVSVDLVESVNNVLKSLAEAALQALSSTGAVAREISITVVDAVKDYTGGLQAGFLAQAGADGLKDGARAFRWLRRLALGGAATGTAIATYHELISQIPAIASWLLSILRLII